MPTSQNRQLYQRIIEASPCGMLLVNKEGTIVLVNKTMEQLFGYSRDEFLNKSMEMLVPERFRKSHLNYRGHFWDSLETRPMGAGRDLLGFKKDGSEFPLEIGLNPLEIEGEMFVLASVVDITPRKILEELLEKQAKELERSNKELEQFAYVASHDLQEPLRKIEGFSGLLKDYFDGKLEEEPKEYLNYIINGAKRMSVLIQDILRYSRTGQATLDFEEVNFNAIIKEVLINLETPIERSQAVIKYNNLPTLKVHRTFIVSLFQNLIENSLKYCGKNIPQIEISAREVDNQWEFAISDNGIGIDPKFISQLFIIFRRLHNKSEHEGTGIGLALCKRIIERHGGKIWIEPHSGKGAMFKFTLPICS